LTILSQHDLTNSCYRVHSFWEKIYQAEGKLAAVRLWRERQRPIIADDSTSCRTPLSASILP
jgi:hypothetical protein